MRRQFQKLDKDSSGSIDRAEMELAIASFGLKLNSDEIDELMTETDGKRTFIIIIFSLPFLAFSQP